MVEQKSITIRESGTAAIFHGNGHVQINQKKQFAKSDFDYTSVHLKEDEILRLADDIREMRKKERVNHKSTTDMTTAELIMILQSMDTSKKAYVGDLRENCPVETVLSVEEADSGIVIKSLGGWTPSDGRG